MWERRINIAMLVLAVGACLGLAAHFFVEPHVPQGARSALRDSAAGSEHFLARSYAGAEVSYGNAQIAMRRKIDQMRGGQTIKLGRFAGRNIANSDFSGADLSKISFEGSDLSKAKFSGALMAGADLDDARIVEANFEGANLTAAALTDGKASGANFRKATLKGANMLGADLAAADFDSADLSDARLDGANMTGARLNNAKATGARLIIANLADADFSDADLSGAALKGSNAARAIFAGANLAGAALADTVLNGADLTGAVGLTQAQLSAACGDETSIPPAGMRLPLCRDRSRHVEGPPAAVKAKTSNAKTASVPTIAEMLEDEAVAKAVLADIEEMVALQTAEKKK